MNLMTSMKLLKQKKWWRLETLLILLAIGFSFFSSYLKYLHDDQTKKFYANKYQVTEILVSNGDLKMGHEIKEGSIRVKEILLSSRTDNMISTTLFHNIKNKRLRINIKDGDPILLTNVAGASDGSLADHIPPGMRYFSLVTKDSLVAQGAVKVNDHVDILAHIKLPGRKLTTFTILEDVTVVSIADQGNWNSGGSSQRGNSIGFYVTPEDIEFLTFAQKQGSFSVSLRNPDDVAKMKRENNRVGVDYNTFLDHRTIIDASGGGKLDVVQGKINEK